jgi:predicted nucleotidyltransferase
MDSTHELTLMPEIIRRILSVSSPQKIILFGSYARGDFDQDSDLDFLVIMDEIASPRAESIRLRRALRGLMVSIDVIVATPPQLEKYRHTIGLIYREALNEGKVLYEQPTAA